MCVIHIGKPLFHRRYAQLPIFFRFHLIQLQLSNKPGKSVDLVNSSLGHNIYARAIKYLYNSNIINSNNNELSSLNNIENVSKLQTELKNRQSKQNLDTKSILLYTSNVGTLSDSNLSRMFFTSWIWFCFSGLDASTT